MEIKINKEDLKTGDILLVSSHSWLAKKIQFFQKNKWNHAGIVIECWGEWFICEADKKGICLTALDDYLNSDKSLMICRPQFDYDEKKISTFMLPYCGHVGYDYSSLLFFQLLAQVFGKWVGKKGDEAARRFYCSEWCAFVHNQFNQSIFPFWYSVAPKDIFNDIINFRHLILKN